MPSEFVLDKATLDDDESNNNNKNKCNCNCKDRNSALKKAEENKHLKIEIILRIIIKINLIKNNYRIKKVKNQLVRRI